MRICVPTETAHNEQRVALAPDSAGRLVKSGLEVVIQRGAGLHAGFRDEAYSAAGARLVDDARGVFAGASAGTGAGNSHVVVKVQPPNESEIALMCEGTTLVSLMRPGQHA